MVLMKTPSLNFGPKQYAHIRETIEWQNYTSNVITGNMFCLSEFTRANRLSVNFKWVRPARVTYTYEPMFNTYQPTPGFGSPGIPYLYTVMNRTQDQALLGFNSPSNLLAQGAKPKKLAKIIKISYVPNWCSPGLISYNVASLPGGVGGAVNNIVQIGSKVEYGWVPCPNRASVFSTGTTEGIQAYQITANAVNTGGSLNGFGGLGNTPAPIVTNSIMYNGHYTFIEQLNKLNGTVCKVSVTVDWVFKDPNFIDGLNNTDLFNIDSSGNVTAAEPNYTETE